MASNPAIKALLVGWKRSIWGTSKIDSSNLQRRHRCPGPHKKVSSWPLLQVLEDKCQCADVLVPPCGGSVIYRWRGEKKKHLILLKGNEFEMTYPTKREKGKIIDSRRYIASRKGIGRKNAKLHSLGDKKKLQTPQQILCLI